MVTEKPMKYKILIVFSAVIVSAFLILLALSGGNLAIIKCLFIQDLSNEEMRNYCLDLVGAAIL